MSMDIAEPVGALCGAKFMELRNFDLILILYFTMTRSILHDTFDFQSSLSCLHTHSGHNVSSYFRHFFGKQASNS